MGRRGGQPPLVNVLQPQDQVTYLPGLPDPDSERRLMAWLMALICGALSLEWQTSSPPPKENFLEPPTVTHGPYDFDKIMPKRTV